MIRQSWNIVFTIFMFHLFICVCVHAMMLLWSSDDQLQELLLSYLMILEY